MTRRRVLAAAALPALFLVLFLVLPLAALLDVAAPAATLGEWERGRLAAGLALGLLTTLLALVFGLPIAWLLGRHRFRGRRALRALVTVPFVVPVVVASAGFLALLGPTGLVAKLTGLRIPFQGTYAALLAAHAFFNAPLVVRLVGDTWAHLDPRLEEAAASLGASPRETFLRVTLPRLMPSIAAASLLAFLFGFTAFGTVLFLGDPVEDATLEVAVWHVGVRLFDLPTAATLALLQLGVTLLAALAYTRLVERASEWERPVDEETGLRPLARGSRPLVALAFLAALLPLLPLAAVVVRSLMTPDGFGLGAYERIFGAPDDDVFYVTPARAIANSLRFAFFATLVAVPLGLLAALAVARSRRGFLADAAWMLPLGAGAATLGLGLLVAFPWRFAGWRLDLRATAVLLVVAHVLVAFPFVVRALVGPLRATDPSLGEAARTLGAGAWRRALRVHLPLLGPALGVAAVLAAGVSLGEFGSTLVLLRPEHATVPAEMHRHLSASRPDPWLQTEGMALATILLLLNAVAFLLVERLRPGRSGGF